METFLQSIISKSYSSCSNDTEVSNDTISKKSNAMVTVVPDNARLPSPALLQRQQQTREKQKNAVISHESQSPVAVQLSSSSDPSSSKRVGVEHCFVDETMQSPCGRSRDMKQPPRTPKVPPEVDANDEEALGDATSPRSTTDASVFDVIERLDMERR